MAIAEGGRGALVWGEEEGSRDGAVEEEGREGAVEGERGEAVLVMAEREGMVEGESLLCKRMSFVLHIGAFEG